MAPPPQGAVVATLPSSCTSVSVTGTKTFDCGGAFYAAAPGGYKLIPPPIGAGVTLLPNGAVDQNINGVTYFTYGGAYYRPYYSGSSIFYQVVPKPA